MYLLVHNLLTQDFFVGFEVLTAVVMKSNIFWDVTKCRPLKVKRRFGGTYRLHLQGRIHRAGYHREKRTTRHYIPEDSTLPQFLFLYDNFTVQHSDFTSKEVIAFQS
jgi:hypothetical protein